MAFLDKLPVKFLLTTSPCYNASKIQLAEALYHAGDSFDVIKRRVLYSRAADKNMAYLNSRLQHAEYVAYISGIFDQFISTAFTNPPSLVFSATTQDIDTEAKLAYYNTLNECLDDLLKGRALDMILHGYGLLTVSYPNEIGYVRSLGEQIKAGSLDAKLTYLPIDTVEDWQTDTLGNLQWVKTHTVELTRSVPFGECDLEKHTWTYFTNDQKVIYEATKKTIEVWTDKDFANKVYEKSITTGLPIFECSQGDRICLFERVKRAAIGLFNREASLDFALFSQCYGQACYSGEKNQNEIAGEANEFALWMLGPNGKFEYVIPKDVAFQSLEKNAEKKQQNLMTCINAEALQLGQRDQHAASGAAKQQDRMPVESYSAMLASHLTCVLNKAVNYIIASRGDTGIIKYKVQGLDSFNNSDLSDTIDDVTKFVQLPVGKTAKALVLASLSQQMADNATPEERKTIDDEQEEALQTEQQAATSATTSTTTNTTTTSANSRNSMSSGNTTSAAPIEGKEKLPGDKKLVVKPELKNINPKNIVNLHGLDEPFVKELADKIKAEGYNKDYPVLAIGYPNNVYLLLDGHHRGNASKQIGLKAIPAWVIDHQDLQPLLAARFGSDLPDKLSELDKYISVNGKSYSELRENNSHTNNSSSTKSSVRSSATTSTRS
jgi:hypothetical protein